MVSASWVARLASLAVPIAGISQQSLGQTVLELSNDSAPDSCTQCREGLWIAKDLAQADPDVFRATFKSLCQLEQAKSLEICIIADHGGDMLAHILNMLSRMDPNGSDGEYFCHYLVGHACALPELRPADLSALLPPKPKHVHTAESVGETFNVLHLSDIHIQLSYQEGSAGECVDQSMCCRPAAVADPSMSPVTATRFGYFRCDSPQTLVKDTLINVAESGVDFDFAIFTGDMVAHDTDASFEHSIEEEKQSLSLMHRYLGNNTPVYAVLGNHDSFPYSQVAPQSSEFAHLFEFNGELLGNMSRDFGWIDDAAAAHAAKNDGAYSMTVPSHPGLRVISFNSNHWYRQNLYVYGQIDADVDPSGLCRYLIKELAEAEARGQRVWLLGHGPSGGVPDGSMPIASDAFKQIVQRFSDTITGVFFGHTHRDEFYIWYQGDGSEKSVDTAIATAWVSQSITPIPHYNPGWRYYTVDTKTFEITNSFNYFTQLTDAIEDPTVQKLQWHLGYSAREAYSFVDWPQSAPLNGSFWHQVAEAVRSSPAVAQEFTDHSYRYSKYVPDCSSRECRERTYCLLTSMTSTASVQCLAEAGVEWRKELSQC